MLIRLLAQFAGDGKRRLKSVFAIRNQLWIVRFPPIDKQEIYTHVAQLLFSRDRRTGDESV